MKVIYEFDPFALSGVEAPKGEARDQALEEIAEYIKTEALSYIADGRSPVAGGSFKRTLSPDYKDRKESISGVDYANLELHGDMLNALECESTRGTKLKFGIEGAEAPKADGHNNFSGESNLPAREFIPNASKGQTFRREIIKGIRQIAEEYADGGED